MNQDLARQLWNYDPETGVFTWRVKPAKNIAVGRETGSPDADGYLHLCYQGRRYKAHRVAWLYVHGSLPDGMEVDHRDHCRDNNRIGNLRLATRKQNGENTRNRRPGQFRGVYWWKTKNYWVAAIKHHGERKTLGYFHTLIDAVAARLNAERRLFTHAPSNT